MLDVFADSFNLSDEGIFKEIQRGYSDLVACLAAKGIRYQELKSALIPDAKKLERAYMFDWNACSSSWYGNEVHNRLLPLLPRDSSRSVLVGDWLGRYSFVEILQDSKNDPGEHVFVHAAVPETVYFVYLNNLSESAAQKIDTELRKYHAYIGFLDLTYMSLVKAMLAHMLMKIYIQHKSIIIQHHEDDTLPEEDENLLGYNFKKHGYQERSVPQTLYQWFLSYKIECPVIPIHSSDNWFSLNALTPNPVALQDLELILDRAKHQYLLNEKEGSMKRSGMLQMTADEIAAQIKAKLDNNYLYNLAWTDQDSTLKFNIMLEKPGVAKYLVALKYVPHHRELRVLTIF
ncbi:hypothetical protein [Pseudoduganella aquatica]|uniref:Uncharacterized protein n=1 Tax=Pseudoduganella aquatica TaxID=2660641 RepID=A0A7X4HEB3_9BURK|nr:hypothetical protein [Pseudoduganella aquatica]MYN09203.1 hypothetical protein [Pseudoduganella aquatica]